jgi:uncharacterized cupin superfamily protein
MLDSSQVTCTLWEVEPGNWRAEPDQDVDSNQVLHGIVDVLPTGVTVEFRTLDGSRLTPV